MPAGDRTGPSGWGPMTGRGFGYCAGYPTPGYATAGFGGWGSRGRGRGRVFGPGFGGGRGFRHRNYYAGGFGWGYASEPMPYPQPYYGFQAQDEKEFLVRQAEEMKNALDNIQKRIDELGKADKQK